MTAHEWGRVDEDGTVFVRTADGERAVGSYPAGTPEEALRFFTDRYEGLALEVELVEKRVTTRVLGPDDAAAALRRVRDQVSGANAVGDLAGLESRLDALGGVVDTHREERRAERARELEQARSTKEELVAQAELLAAGDDWRRGANRLRDLLERWKALPRLDRPTDDALWKRFSGARTAFTKARKAHFAEQDRQRESARGVKERLATEAEALADSTDWGPTSSRYRDLMRDWKAAGPAPRDVEEQLWRRFRGAQDQFFGARDAANRAQDQEYAANAEVKDALLVEAEALVPVTDLDAAKRTFRGIAERWDAAGKVPRDRMKELEGRFRAVEQAIRGAEDRRWTRSDPEKSARADDMVAKLEAAIVALETEQQQARDAGDERRAERLESDLASRRMFLDAARRASQDFG